MRRSARMWRRIFVAAAVAATSGCTQSIGDPNGSGSSEPIIGGTETFEHTEVGFLVFEDGGCTATLLTQRIAITAAHCLKFQSCDQPGCSKAGASFRVDQSASSSRSFGLGRYKSFGTSAGSADVALIELSEDVSQDLAVASGLGSSDPSNGTRVTIFGYGCTNRRTQAGALTKRKIDFNWGSQTRAVCFGDSGGPTLAGSSVVRVTSAFTGAGTDVFGNSVAHHDELLNKIIDWEDHPNTDPCAANTDCGTCTANPRCGFCCGSVNTCMTGTQSGPSNGSCSHWVFLSSQCGM